MISILPLQSIGQSSQLKTLRIHQLSPTNTVHRTSVYGSPWLNAATLPAASGLASAARMSWHWLTNLSTIVLIPKVHGYYMTSNNHMELIVYASLIDLGAVLIQVNTDDAKARSILSHASRALSPKKNTSPDSHYINNCVHFIFLSFSHEISNLKPRTKIW